MISEDFKLKEQMKLNEENAFGFSLVSEEELKAAEKELQTSLAVTSQAAQQTSKGAKEALYGLRDMIKPLLNNLAVDSGKTYVYWPDRATKMRDFIKKVDAYVEAETKKLS